MKMRTTFNKVRMLTKKYPYTTVAICILLTSISINYLQEKNMDLSKKIRASLYPAYATLNSNDEGYTAIDSSSLRDYSEIIYLLEKSDIPKGVKGKQ